MEHKVRQPGDAEFSATKYNGDSDTEAGCARYTAENQRQARLHFNQGALE